MEDIVNLASNILEDLNLCDHCLGRQFAKLSHGLGNDQRGKALRICVGMATNIEVKQPKHCEICEGRFSQVSEWSRRAYQRVTNIQFFSFHMGTKVPAHIAEKEKELRDKYSLSNAGEFGHEFNREVGKRFEDILRKKGKRAQLDLKNPDVVLIMDLPQDRIEVQINPIFIGGRYRKLIRGIPQTKWPCKNCRGKGCPECDFTGKRYKESVEELITPPILEAFRGSDSSFHGAGREDIDARMLGSGRPFILEIKEPKIRDLKVFELEDTVNRFTTGEVEVELTRFVNRDNVRKLKNTKFEKLYLAKVNFDQEVSEEKLKASLDELKGEIRQRTPLRVSHRRADKVRIREVLEISGGLINGTRAEVKVKGESGLYIKELISGDEGRTQPNLSDLLGVRCEVNKLDVLEVD